jgi:dephospho-CoA kinase
MSAPGAGASPPKRIGVLGGIASGKSRVARLLAGERGLVIDADALAREELESPSVVERIRRELGAELIDAEGRPDREALSRLVFGSPQARRALEGWIHPRVRERIRASLDGARSAGRSPAVLDVPLLLENDAEHGLARLCDFLVFVDAAPAVREQRAIESRGWPAGEVERRERTQMPLESKRARARYVIDNDAGLAELDAAVARIRRAESIE